MATKPDLRMQAYDDQTRVSGLVYVVMIVIALAFGAFVWNLYAGHDAPVRIQPPAGAYKIAPPSDAPADAGEVAPPDGADAPDDAATAATSTTAAATTTTTAPAPIAARAQLSPAPAFVANGPFVAQIAALQSEAGVEPAWQRLASRAPQLFAAAQRDVERADLGQRGIYYRIRAGYFADRENARRFCARITQMGQDCIVVQR